MVSNWRYLRLNMVHWNSEPFCCSVGYPVESKVDVWIKEIFFFKLSSGKIEGDWTALFDTDSPCLRASWTKRWVLSYVLSEFCLVAVCGVVSAFWSPVTRAVQGALLLITLCRHAHLEFVLSPPPSPWCWDWRQDPPGSDKNSFPLGFLL